MLVRMSSDALLLYIFYIFLAKSRVGTAVVVVRRLIFQNRSPKSWQWRRHRWTPFSSFPQALVLPQIWDIDVCIYIFLELILNEWECRREGCFEKTLRETQNWLQRMNEECLLSSSKMVDHFQSLTHSELRDLNIIFVSCLFWVEEDRRAWIQPLKWALLLFIQSSPDVPCHLIIL